MNDKQCDKYKKELDRIIDTFDKIHTTPGKVEHVGVCNFCNRCNIKTTSRGYQEFVYPYDEVYVISGETFVSMKICKDCLMNLKKDN